MTPPLGIVIFFKRLDFAQFGCVCVAVPLMRGVAGSKLVNGKYSNRHTFPPGPLAEQLRVNRNTVLKAYLELENQNVIESFPGKGSFVKRAKSPLKREARHAMLNREIDQAVVAAHHLQVSREDFLELVNERFDEFEQRREAASALKTQTP